MPSCLLNIGIHLEEKATAIPEVLQKQDEVGRATSVTARALDLLEYTNFGSNRARMNSGGILSFGVPGVPMW